MFQPREVWERSPILKCTPRGCCLPGKEVTVSSSPGGKRLPGPFIPGCSPVSAFGDSTLQHCQGCLPPWLYPFLHAPLTEGHTWPRDAAENSVIDGEPSCGRGLHNVWQSLIIRHFLLPAPCFVHQWLMQVASWRLIIDIQCPHHKLKGSGGFTGRWINWEVQYPRLPKNAVHVALMRLYLDFCIQVCAHQYKGTEWQIGMCPAKGHQSCRKHACLAWRWDGLV